MNKRKTYTVLERMFGRDLLWRMGRWLYLSARRESKNDPRFNGEYDLLRWYCNSQRVSKKTFACFDVGAMHADWTFAAIAAAAKSELEFEGKVFEASPTQADRIRQRIDSKEQGGLELRSLAVSSQSGKARFATTGENTGSSTLVLRSAGSAKTIEVDVTTIDVEIERAGWSSVDMVKIDTEGHDYSVVTGCLDSLRSGRIGVLQFEYNWRWLDDHNSIKDVFELIELLPYRLGKLCEDQIELYRDWHPELDRFIETNYVLVRKDLVDQMPAYEYDFKENNLPTKV